MMDWTDRHDRYFLRLIAPDIQLYTEMITSYALIHGDADYLLQYDPAEHYLVLQLGGSIPKDLAHSAKLGEDAGYDEINLNVGCPSPRVSSGKFGACLMYEPKLVADCISAMNQAVKIPVTVKCRIGVDNQDSYAELCHFIETIKATGCDTFIIHARKAWLKGLSPKQNRDIPPLQYDTVYQIKKDFPTLNIIINGGIKSLEQTQQHLNHVDGVMIGREAYSNPYFLAQLQQYYFSETALLRDEVINALIPYIQKQLQHGTRLNQMTRHILGLYAGLRGAAAWRRYLSENAYKTNAGIEVIQQAMQILKGQALT